MSDPIRAPYTRLAERYGFDPSQPLPAGMRLGWWDAPPTNPPGVPRVVWFDVGGLIPHDMDAARDPRSGKCRIAGLAIPICCHYGGRLTLLDQEGDGARKRKER